jgi:hypothetical protein
MIRFRERSERKCSGVAKDQYYVEGNEWPGQMTRIVIDGVVLRFSGHLFPRVGIK